jgi:acyl-coenzyme A synthetase/AMP-(fatty) acid ligase
VLVVNDEVGGGSGSQLVARGSNISRLLEQARRPQAEALGYRTGDLGYADEEGFRLVEQRHDQGRRTRGRRSRGRSQRHPAISEAAVVPVRGILGEPFAFIATAGQRAGHLDI